MMIFWYRQSLSRDLTVSYLQVSCRIRPIHRQKIRRQRAVGAAVVSLLPVSSCVLPHLSAAAAARLYKKQDAS